MIIDKLNKYRIILASRSPRRQQLLRELGISFEVVEMDYTETIPENCSGKEIAMCLAEEKAKCFLNLLKDNELVITADTIVWLKNQVLGKPKNKADAIRMISELSGNTHEVITGVTILSAVKQKTFSDTTTVTFEKFSGEEIEFYVEEYKPYDKAGAYGLQEWIGIAGCSRIEGSYFNVIGLPVQKLYQELKDFIK